MDTDCECLFCQRNDLNLYEINNNSVLIGSDLVDFGNLIFEIFFAKTSDDIISFICEECKDIMTQFYIFKTNTKQNLSSTHIFERLKEFLDSSEEKSDPIMHCSATKFTVSFENKKGEGTIPEETYEIETIIETIDEEPYNDDETMPEEEGEIEPYYETEEESEVKELPEEPEVIHFAPESSAIMATIASSFNLQKTPVVIQKRGQKPTRFTCCDMNFKEQKYGEIHEKAHENFEAIALHIVSNSCLKCRVMFSSEDDIVQHMLQHQTEGDVLKDYLIKRPSAYEDHMLKPLTAMETIEIDYQTEDLYNCGHCNKRLTELDMRVHLLLFHTLTFTCPLDNRCFDGAKQIRLFSDHIRNKHPEIFNTDDLFSCRHCNKNFTSNFQKLAHMKKCDSKLFACVDHCNKRFATEWLLKNHMKLVMGEERFSCEMCGKRCVSRSDLQIHCRSHTNERPYECPICNRSFKTSANRSSHLDIHETEKRHDCDVCGEKFQTRPILRKHKKKHDMKYQGECVCKVCDRKYISKPHLLRHIKSSHGGPSFLTTDGMKEFFEEYLTSHERE